jgi:hypothetical protein
MNEQISRIISNGTKEVIESEPVLGGLTRPLVIRYTSEEGVVDEIWSYVPDSAMERWWGAISGVSYNLINTTQNEEG